MIALLASTTVHVYAFSLSTDVLKLYLLLFIYPSTQMLLGVKFVPLMPVRNLLQLTFRVKRKNAGRMELVLKVGMNLEIYCKSMALGSIPSWLPAFFTFLFQPYSQNLMFIYIVRHFILKSITVILLEDAKLPLHSKMVTRV